MNNNINILILLCIFAMQITSCSSGDNDDDILATTEYLNVTNHISIDGMEVSLEF